VVWRYLVDRTKSVKAGHEVVIWRVDVAFFAKEDWKYEGSGASSSGGGRTHTFGVRTPATKLRESAVYFLPGVEIHNGHPVLAEDDPVS
jgi:hypothetical protein